MRCKTWGKTDATPAWILLSRPAHVDSWRGSVRALGDGVVHPDASAVQLHAVGSLHRLDGNKTGSDWGEHSGRNHWCYRLKAPLLGRTGAGWRTLGQGGHLVVKTCNHTHVDKPYDMVRGHLKLFRQCQTSPVVAESYNSTLPISFKTNWSKKCQKLNFYSKQTYNSG